jgi:hypothetical protein
VSRDLNYRFGLAETTSGEKGHEEAWQRAALFNKL